jgi:hypothetical protein
MIPIYKCKDGFVYRLTARNIRYGVWEEKRRVFRGIRIKFMERFLDTENHWDEGPPHGTAKPVEEIEKFTSRGDLFSYLMELEKRRSNASRI